MHEGVMAERRYGFRFSLVEAGIILISLFSASFLIFLFGIYIGTEVQARKAIQQTRTVRLPVPLADEFRSSTPSSSANASFPEPAAQPRPKEQPKERRLQAAEPSPAPLQFPRGTMAQTPVVKTPLPVKKPEPKPAPVSAVAPPLSGKRTELLPQDRKSEEPTGRWSVQVQATQDERVARETAERLRAHGYLPVVSKLPRHGGVVYRVRISKLANEEEAKAVVTRVRREGNFPHAYLVSE
jgi:cell division septation protein DedD